MDRLALLDLDDTLLDNSDADIASFQFVLDGSGVHCPDRATILAWRQRGMLSRSILMRVLGDTQLVYECMEGRRIFLAGDMGRSLLGVKHDTMQFLSLLRPRYQLVVVTARDNKNDVQSILDQLGIAPYVDGVLCAQDICGSKPDGLAELKKELYSMAMQMYSVEKERCVAVGNLKSDIVAGIELGITAYAVSGSYGFDRGIRRLTRSFGTLSDLARFILKDFNPHAGSGSMSVRDYKDFTEKHYINILNEAKKHYEFVFFGTTSNAPHILLRHDLDASVYRALRLARIERECGVLSTYFLRLHGDFYNPLEKETYDMVRTIADMGHRIGLHFDTEFYGRIVDKKKLEDFLLQEKQFIEEWFNVDVLVVSFHNPQAAGLMGFNEDSYCGMVNTYGEGVMRTHKYVSDSNGYWRFDRLYDVIYGKKHHRLQVLIHPEWWQEKPKTPKQRIRDVIEYRARSSMNEYLKLLESAERPDVG